MKVLFLENPHSGGKGGRKVVDIALNRFAKVGWDTTPITTESPQHAEELIKSATDEGYELLVIAGGDGTIHHTVQHLPIGSNEEPSKLPFAIFPLGSGNDFFRGTGAPRDPEGAAENIVNGRPAPVDIGIVEPIDDDGKPRDQRRLHFINTVGVGMDSQTLATREKAPKFMSARYEVLFLLTLMRLYPLEVSLSTDRWDLDVNAYWVLVCNNEFIGTGMNVAPGAKTNDGEFDILIVEKMSKFKFISYMKLVFKGTHTEVDGIEIHRAKEIVLRCSPNQRVAADGDRSFEGPVKIRCLPGAVTLWTSWLNREKL